MTAPKIDLHPQVGDEIRKTTCYMCACRCGIDVHIKTGADGRERVAYIEGNRDHPVNRGVLCAKGSGRDHAAQRALAPARADEAVGPRGSGEFEEISWDEAL